MKHVFSSKIVLQDPRRKINRYLLKPTTGLPCQRTHQDHYTSCSSRPPSALVMPLPGCLSCFIRQDQRREPSKMVCPSLQIKAEHFILFLSFKRQGKLLWLSKQIMEVHPGALSGLRVEVSGVPFIHRLGAPGLLTDP